jgi:UDP-glucose 4-epimerase
MKILVTGGTGYIGSHYIIEQIRNTDWDIVSIDNYLNSSPRTIERIEKISGRKVLNYEIDLRDQRSTLKFFEDQGDIRGIVHFAALKSVPESVEEPLLYYDNNINGLLNILTAIEQFRIPYFIFSSSASVYGNVEKLPVDEQTPMGHAECPYAHTKQIGEGILEHFYRKHPDLHGIALRYFNPVGADETGLNGEDPINRPTNLVPVITQVASGILPQLVIYGNDWNTRDGTCIRDYIHVSDIAEAHIQALEYLIEEKAAKNYEIFNLGTGNGVSVLEAVNAFEKTTGEKLNYTLGSRRPGDVEAVYSDNRYTESQLGWTPKRNIEEMMRSAWKWQQNLNRETGR